MSFIGFTVWPALLVTTASDWSGAVAMPGSCWWICQSVGTDSWQTPFSSLMVFHPDGVCPDSTRADPRKKRNNCTQFHKYSLSQSHHLGLPHHVQSSSPFETNPAKFNHHN